MHDSRHHALTVICFVLPLLVLPACEPAPRLGISAASHTFEQEAEPWIFEVWAAGPPIAFVLEHSAAWLDISPLEGESVSSEDRVAITVTVLPEELAEGCNRTELLVRWGGLEVDPARWSLRRVFISAVGDPPGEGCAPITETVRLYPSRDVTLYEDQNGLLANGAGQYFFTGLNSDLKVRRAGIAFDIAENIPENATVLEAALTLYHAPVTPDTGAQDVDLARAARDWGEGLSRGTGDERDGTYAAMNDATWRHAFFASYFWSTPGGDWEGHVVARRRVTGAGAYTWETDDLVADVQAWLDRPSRNYGWLLFGDEEAPEPEGEADKQASFPGTLKRFATKENLDELKRPVLSVTYEYLP